MPTFETLSRFERDWKNLTWQQQALFRKAVLEAFVPDLMAPDRPVRPGLRVKGVADRRCVRDDMGQRRPGDLQLRGRTGARPAARHLAADRNPRHLHPSGPMSYSCAGPVAYLTCLLARAVAAR